MVVLRAKMEEVWCTCLDQRYHVPLSRAVASNVSLFGRQAARIADEFLNIA
jgi:hypothetical protein